MEGVKLINNSGFQWYSNENCQVKGCFFDSEGKLYQGEEMLSYFDGVASTSDFSEKVKKANGVFSVVLKSPAGLFIAVDTIRSFPLFYMKKGSVWLVSDNADYLKGQLENPVINVLARNEFRAAGYVTGSNTLIEGLQQVQAGEIVELTEEYARNFYFSYRVKKIPEFSYDQMKEEGIRHFEQAFERLVASLDGRTAVVPLSGGYDSRLIAVMLKKLGYEKVVCFTYGRKDNPEAVISQKVAKALGFKWIFIEYTDELRGEYLETEEFREYYKWGSNLSSMFYLQEYFAVKYLKDHQHIPANSVFIPGHSGDFLGGSQFLKHSFSASKETLDDMVDRIFRVKYLYDEFGRAERKKLKERIKQTIIEKGSDTDDLAYSVHEDWDFKEKLAKFNFNSNSTYTFWNFEFRIPYWDLDLLRFFQHLPVEAKSGKKLYDEILTAHYFEPFGVNYSRELQASSAQIKIQVLKDRIKKFIPDAIKNSLSSKKDKICSIETTAKLKEDLISRGGRFDYKGDKTNKIIIEWYLFDLSN